MNSKTQSPIDKWALFRFSVVGGLLANPPAKGELRKELERLSHQIYTHPITDESTVFHFSTIESWYYKAKNAQDPIIALGRKVRSDYGGSIVFLRLSLEFHKNHYKLLSLEIPKHFLEAVPFQTVVLQHTHLPFARHE